MEKSFEVALVKEMCKICGKTFDGPIVMNTRLTKSEADKVKDMHGKVIGFSEKPCEECQSNMKLSFILIECDETKTDDYSNPYRTGKQWVIKKEAAQRIFNENFDMSHGAAYIDIETAKKIGLYESIE
jgi:hypothetical protein